MYRSSTEHHTIKYIPVTNKPSRGPSEALPLAQQGAELRLPGARVELRAKKDRAPVGQPNLAPIANKPHLMKFYPTYLTNLSGEHETLNNVLKYIVLFFKCPAHLGPRLGPVGLFCPVEPILAQAKTGWAPVGHAAWAAIYLLGVNAKSVTNLGS